MDVQKLAKVLALAASDNETEAVHALRMARRLLDAHGLDFVELARRAAEGAPAVNEALEDAVFNLRNEIRQLRCENERLKQGRAPVVPAAEPTSFLDAARDVAAAIRLRAEIATLNDVLELERAEMHRLKAREASLHQAVHDAQSEAARLGAKLAELDVRRMRVEVENRRMLHANHALGVELEEVKAERIRITAEMATSASPQEFHGKRLKTGIRAKAKGIAGQYALL